MFVSPQQKNFGGYLMISDLWGQKKANITGDSEIVCNATVTASVQRSVLSGQGSSDSAVFH